MQQKIVIGEIKEKWLACISKSTTSFNWQQKLDGYQTSDKKSLIFNKKSQSSSIC